MNQMTILEMLLEKLPDNYVDAVINNMDKPSDLQQQAICFEVDFLSLFDWSNSLEGYDFLEEVLESVMDGEELPQLPIQIEYKPSTYIIADDSLYVMNSAGTGINVQFDIEQNKLSSITQAAYERYSSWVN
jgi:hypothetical protein